MTPDDILVEVTDEDAADALLLRPPSERKLGGAPDLKTKRVQFRLGRRPIFHDVRALYEREGRHAALEVFTGYQIWMVMLSVGVVRYEGVQDVRFVGCEVRFPDKPRITIAGLAPQTQFIRSISGDAGVRLESKADLGLSGDLAMPEEVSQLLGVVGDAIALGGSVGAKIKASVHANIVGELSFAVMTPIVQAVGIGDHRAEWLLRKHKEPLVGDHLLVLTVLAPKNVEELRFEARVSGVVSTFDLVSTSLISGWIPLVCDLTAH